jgi:redox-sensing transcriptional repressor
MPDRTRHIPEATVARLPVYLRSLAELVDEKTTTVSSEQTGRDGGVNAAKVRKDLSYLGSYGTRGVGYDVEYLLFQMSRELGLTHDWPVVIMGAGNLGSGPRQLRRVHRARVPRGRVDRRRPSKVGQQFHGVEVHHIDDLPRLARELGIAIGIIATPAGAAQTVADQLVAAGIRSILNFAPAVITVPPGASLRKVDLALELQILSFYQQHAPADLEASPRA